MLVFSYNATVHSTTGHTPYSLLFGLEPNLPIGLEDGYHKSTTSPVDSYVVSSELAETLNNLALASSIYLDLVSSLCIVTVVL